jgi:2-polyprenyl-6-methoxyphenol hydroxylase-like FAD-dependent oxidoreductase
VNGVERLQALGRHLDRVYPPVAGDRAPGHQTRPLQVIDDAVHNMTPMAGIGANTALRDADGLRRALLAPGPDDVTGRVGRYEEQMRGYANQALALSARNARNAASPRRLPRLAFRSALRIAESVPPAKRRMFGGVPAPVTR